ncbi:MAG: hypothetical protein RL367_271 [Pseudomonadota bacterium]|jgi:hypothetical protein
MTSINLTLDLPDSLAREAEAAGLLSPRAVAQLLRDGVRRKAAERLLAGAARASAAGSKPMSMAALQREVDAVRRDAGTRAAA